MIQSNRFDDFAGEQKQEKDFMKKIYIEPTSNCNLSCKMCSRNAWFDEKVGDMDMELFYKIMDEIEITDSIETIFFGGIAEPFANKNIMPMLNRAALTGKKVEIITNGMLLDEEIITNLLLLKIDTLWVSIDGADEKSYEEIRLGASYSKVIENLKCFNARKIKLGMKSKLGLTFVAMKSNIHQLPSLIWLANTLRACELKVSNLIPYDKQMIDEVLYSRGITSESSSERSFNIRNNDLSIINSPIINIPIMDFSNPEVKSLLGDIFQYSNLLRIGENNIIRKTDHCKFIDDNSLFIRWDGEVSPCMALLHNNVTYLSTTERRITHCSFGNVKEMRLIDIWNGDEYINFRNRVREFAYSHCTICGHCNYVEENKEDCFGNTFPTCGGCVWKEGFARCP